VGDRAHRRFRLQVGSLGEADVAVSRVSGAEGLSEPFRFEVDFAKLDGTAVTLERLLAVEARLAFVDGSDAERYVHGICVRAEHTGVVGGVAQYRVTIGPKLLLLGETEESRVFQEQSALEIAGAVLKEGGITFRQATSASYPSRPMCLQYRETDLAFVSRLLEEEGIAYWFEHTADGHTLVLGDAPGAFQALAGGDQLPFRQEAGMAADEDHIEALRRVSRVKPARATLRDFDFERPSLDLTTHAKDGEGAEHYETPGGYVNPDAGARRSQARLEEARFGSETWHGRSTCARLLPGATFGVTEHPSPAFDVRLLAVRVTHEGKQQTSSGQVDEVAGDYENTFVAIQAGRPYRPARRTPRPKARPQTATVVGPAGEEIHLDLHGRIKVQFHWDRKGKKDDRSTAWIRLAQPWAGTAFGAVFVPRIGQEVLVRFLEGDPDRPLASGAVYNGENRTSIQLPDDKTQSTLRSNSSLHGGGYNELRFEDAKGKEQVYQHAQKDEEIEVLNDKAQQIGGGESLEVAKDRSRQVGGDQTLSVTGRDGSVVDGSSTLTVMGDRETQIRGNHTEQVGEVQTVTIGGARESVVALANATTVGAAAALTIGGVYVVNVGGVFNEAVAGVRSAEIGAAAVEVVGLTRTEEVGKNRSAKIAEDWSSDVKGGVVLTVGRDGHEDVGGKGELEVKNELSWSAGGMTLEADALRIVVGGNVVLSLKSSGAVELAGASIVINGSEVALKGSKLAKAASAPPASEQVKLSRLKGADGTAWTTVQAKDDQGEPVRLMRFEAKLPDGKVVRGRTDSEGRAFIPSAKGGGKAKVTFITLDPQKWKA
jgi:type VI secretion system secreted protein VgrG